MSLINYEGPCTICGQRIIWRPEGERPEAGRQPYRFKHNRWKETFVGNATLPIETISTKLHEVNGKRL